MIPKWQNGGHNLVLENGFLLRIIKNWISGKVRKVRVEHGNLGRHKFSTFWNLIKVWVFKKCIFSADSNYNITISTKATLRYDGEVTWEPPAIFKSLCQIDVRWYVELLTLSKVARRDKGQLFFFQRLFEKFSLAITKWYVGVLNTENNRWIFAKVTKMLHLF